MRLAQKARQQRWFFHHPHATTTTAEGSLDDQRKTNFVRGLERLVGIGDRLLGAGKRWHLITMRQRPRRGLVAHVFQQLRRWPDESDALTRTCSCELRVFRKKSITRMNHRHALLLGERDDALDIEVRADRALRRIELIRLIGLEAVDRKAVFFGKNRNRAQTKFVGSAENADRNFSAVGGHQLSRAG